jgi:uncharacterized protein
VDWAVAFAGMGTGLLIGLTGVGGGALMTPVLLLVFGVAPHTAIGTDLWFAALTKLAASRVHSRHGLIDWPVVLRLWCGSLPIAVLALLWLGLRAGHSATLPFLENFIGVAVLVTALGILLRDKLTALRTASRPDNGVEAIKAPLTVATGGVLGGLVTLTSVGAGALGTVFLAYLYPRRLDPRRLVATDIVHAIPLAVFAGLGHLLLGNVNGPLLANLLIGSVPGAVLGSLLSARLPHGLLRLALAGLLCVVGVRLLMP